ncbi:MAG: efflux RND transporter permease subunit [Thermoanaerobaculia bacterium]|nr:efflux RND transporter permease subunit [Thermoanaerobaculia bacterium]
MNVVEFSVKRRVTVTMVAIAVVIFGFVAYTRLPINLLPDISYPTLTVETKFEGAAPAEVESLVTRPIEEVVGIVSGVRRLTSVSRPGLSQVTLEFEWGRNMDFAALDVRQKLELLELPRDAEKPVVLRFDPSNEPIVRLYVTGGEDLYQTRYVAEEVLKKDLESTDGVAAIKVNGGYEEEIQVEIDQGKLALVGLTIQDVNSRLDRENVNQAGGILYEEEARYLVRARNEFTGLDDILETVLIGGDGRNVTVADVGEVRRGYRKRDVITRFEGQESVELAMYKEGDANTVSVSRSIHSRLDRVREELPEGIEVVAGVDQAKFIESSIREVLSNAIVGGLIAVMILLLFLKDVRSTLIIGVSIPLSIIATFFLMYQFGITLNIMSLGGLALGVGMLVDNAIVVLEAIYKRKEAGMDAFDASRLGASEVGRAVVASTLTTVAVFVPVVFLEGIAAQLFLDQALTVSFSLLASLAVALTLIPMMAAFALRERTNDEAEIEVRTGGGRLRRGSRALFFRLPALVLRLLRRAGGVAGRAFRFIARPFAAGFDAFLGAVTKRYPGALGWSLQARWLVVTVAVLIFVASIAMVPQLGLDLIPAFSQGEFSFFVELPEGTPIEVTDRYLASVQETLEGDARVGSFSSVAGGAGLTLSNTGTEGENTGRIYVQMAQGTSTADETAVAEMLRETLAATEEARFKFERPSLFTFRTPIEVEVYSDSVPEIHEAASLVRETVERTPGVVDVKSTAELGNPELQVTFDRDQLSQLDLNLFEVSRTVRNKIQGEVATRFMQGDREIDILVHSVSIGDASIDDVRNLIVAQRDGRPIFLGAVAAVELVEGPSEIRRIGQKRAGVISGNLEGRDMGVVSAEIRQQLRDLKLPGTVTAMLSGQEEEMSRSLNSLIFAMALAIFLVYLVMASQFESFLHPFVIIFTLPLGAVGVIWALLLTGNSITVVAMIGAVMLAGIVVNNAIVLIDAVNQKRESGLPKRDAIIEAGQDRLRPILMTSATTILGLLPMALGIGEGAELRAPLAITVIGGLTVATFLTLIVIPVVYAIFDRKVFEADLREERDEASAPPVLGAETPEAAR